jgi:CBS domain-containing protein
MGKVRYILEQKGNQAIAVDPDTTIFGALEVMQEKNIGGLLVIEGEKLVGIFTERDYSRKVILKGKSSRNTSVRELMTSDPITVTPDTTIEDCMQLMTNKFIRHLPVVESDHVVGVISIGDVVRYIIEEQRHTIESLEHYITGR